MGADLRKNPIYINIIHEKTEITISGQELNEEKRFWSFDFLQKYQKSFSKASRSAPEAK